MTMQTADSGRRAGPGGGLGGEPLPLDALDHAILCALHRDPRAAFSDIAAAADVHERTVARRLERMTATGEVRFTASLVPERLGEGVIAELAVRCTPGRLHETALALARRPDTRSVEVATGSLDAFAEVTAPTPDQLLTAIDGSIGRMDGVVGVHSSIVLQLLLTANDWAPYDDEPTPIRRLLAQGASLPAPIAIDDLDRELVRLLEHDARISTTRLARELNVGETTARRRLGRLLSSHVLHLRLHADPSFLGYPVEGRFRLAIAPRHLDAVLRRLADEPAVRHLVITTGASNLLGYSSHRSPSDFETFVRRALADVDGIIGLESALLLRHYKRAWIPTVGPR